MRSSVQGIHEESQNSSSILSFEFPLFSTHLRSQIWGSILMSSCKSFQFQLVYSFKIVVSKYRTQKALKCDACVRLYLMNTLQLTIIRVMIIFMRCSNSVTTSVKEFARFVEYSRCIKLLIEGAETQ